MTTENEVEQEEDTQIDSQAADDSSEEDNSAFEAGFNKSRGEEPPEEIPANDVAGDEQQDNQPDITDKQAEKLFAGKSESEIQDLFDKVPGLEARLSDETRKLYGRFGDIQGRLQKMEDRANSVPSDISVEDFEELANEFPELTDMLIAGLKKSLAKSGKPQAEQKPSGNPVDIEAIVNAAVEKVRNEQDMKLLNFAHSDWKTIPNEPEFQVFLKSLPGDPVSVAREDGSTIQLPAKAAEYVDSNDALVAAECFTKYKAWKAGQKPSQRTASKNRLEAAITPQGNGGAPPDSTLDDDAAFARGFKKARGTG